MWPLLRPVFIGLTRTPKAERDYTSIQKSYQDTNGLFSLLDQTLEAQAYCSGEQFHIGDIVLALCVHRWILMNDYFPEETGSRHQLKNIDRWLRLLDSLNPFQHICRERAEHHQQMMFNQSKFLRLLLLKLLLMMVSTHK